MPREIPEEPDEKNLPVTSHYLTLSVTTDVRRDNSHYWLIVMQTIQIQKQIWNKND